MCGLLPFLPILGVFIFLFGVKKCIMGWGGAGGIKFTWESCLNIINITLLWSDKPSAECCFRRPSMLLRLMFDSDTMGVGFGLGLSKDLEIRE